MARPITGPAREPVWAMLSERRCMGQAGAMSHYVLEVHYGDGEAPVRIELPGYTPEQAETERQALATEIEHALEIEAPVMYYAKGRSSGPDGGVAIDPNRVTSVDLVSPDT
ncbi:MAG: hypothetical protein QOK11_641 [Pseudonocardiales bacterium]|nr:hypothetical protein [Pseudonocardiales bacterium]